MQDPTGMQSGVILRENFFGNDYPQIKILVKTFCGTADAMHARMVIKNHE